MVQRKSKAVKSPPNRFNPYSGRERKLRNARWTTYARYADVYGAADGPVLVWEKQSFKRYSAILPGAGAHLEVVRSGYNAAGNQAWHPVVFGNRWAGPSGGFTTVSEAMVFAETTAVAYARSTLETLR